jgi:septal ring factor EnvC (AmiA/AmiB activator)
MSPETKVGMCYFDFNRDVYYGDDSDMLTFKDIQGHERRINRGQLKTFIQKFDLVLSANGCVFTQKNEGIFPEYMRTNYENRNKERKDIKRLNAENEKLEDELKQLEKQLRKIKKSG